MATQRAPDRVVSEMIWNKLPPTKGKGLEEAAWPDTQIVLSSVSIRGQPKICNGFVKALHIGRRIPNKLLQEQFPHQALNSTASQLVERGRQGRWLVGDGCAWQSVARREWVGQSWSWRGSSHRLSSSHTWSLLCHDGLLLLLLLRGGGF